MYNFYEAIKENPIRYRQLACDDLLMTEFSCPLEQRMEDTWSHHNYFVYVLEGKKVWHTSDGTYDLEQGSCAFVRKGASIVEQFFEADFCVLMFFVPDSFIYETLRTLPAISADDTAHIPTVIRVESEQTLGGFFQSMLPYFGQSTKPDSKLLELKFRELLLNVVTNSRNLTLRRYFWSIAHDPGSVTLQRIMEENFAFNLGLDEYAKLSNRSLSTFKRDFLKTFGCPPGKWLLQRRLEHARLLLRSPERQVSDVAFESGFENLSHFSRAYRQHFGRSPSEHRTLAAH